MKGHIAANCTNKPADKGAANSVAKKPAASSVSQVGKVTSAAVWAILPNLDSECERELDWESVRNRGIVEVDWTLVSRRSGLVTPVV